MVYEQSRHRLSEAQEHMLIALSLGDAEDEIAGDSVLSEIGALEDADTAVLMQVFLASGNKDGTVLNKDTSLAFVVAVAEMFTKAKQIASSQTTMLPFVIAAIFYYVFNLVVAIAMNKSEKKLNYYH